MSVRIHHGYRLARGTDIFDFCHRLRGALDPVRDRIDARLLISRAIGEIDIADRLGQARPESPLLEAMLDYDRTQDAENARGYRQASVSRQFDPHRFEVSFALDAPRATGAETGTGHVLARLRCEQRDLVTAWEAMDEVEPWGYWDNADPADGVSQADWDERGAAYRRTDPDGATGAGTCLNFSLRSSTYDVAMSSMICADIDPRAESARIARFRDVAPSMHDRARARVRDLCFCEAVRRETGIEDRGEAFKALPSTRVFALLSRYTQISEPSAAYEAMYEAVAATLDPDALAWALYGSSLLETDRAPETNDWQIRRERILARRRRAAADDDTSPAPRLVFAADMVPAEAAVAAFLDAEVAVENQMCTVESED